MAEIVQESKSCAKENCFWAIFPIVVGENGRYTNMAEGSARKPVNGVFIMVQFIGVALAVFGIIYGIAKDYQNGSIKIPNIAPITQTTEVAQPIIYPLQYCAMAYDPNTDKVWYQHDDGVWRDAAPIQKKVGTYYY